MFQTKGRRRQIGWFPATYVKVLQGGRNSGRNTPVSSSRVELSETVLGKRCLSRKLRTSFNVVVLLISRQSDRSLPVQGAERRRIVLREGRHHQCYGSGRARMVAWRIERDHRTVSEQLCWTLCYFW
jgi:hypothetical protein